MKYNEKKNKNKNMKRATALPSPFATCLSVLTYAKIGVLHIYIERIRRRFNQTAFSCLLRRRCVRFKPNAVGRRMAI